EITPLSIISRFIKNFGLPQIKIGILGEKVLSGEEILRLAFLPSREVLMGQIINTLRSPLSRTTNALNWNLQKLILILKAKGGEKNG
ncbi:hypothetical protein HY946_00505, partial [Candidatus Gottesmanbacteria bacterium]|nr:hypothetical protein [Candidatus Gottesmanbacteria bacterium]